MTLSSKLVPTSGCLLGAWVGTSCDPATSILARTHNFEATIGRTADTGGILNVFHSYSHFGSFAGGQAFPAADDAALAAEGRILLLDWRPVASFSPTSAKMLWADITAGAYDTTHIDPTAAKMRDFGQPFFLTFHAEFERYATEYPGVDPKWGSAAEFAAAYRHVWDRFAAVGASNVIWVWNTSGYKDAASILNALYPGDAYVDWIAWDPYSTGASGGWEDFTQVFNTKYPAGLWASGGAPTHNKTSTPTGVTVAQQGAAGSTARGYRVSAVNAAGETLASASKLTATSNATLSVTNFNRVAWSAMSGATSYKVYGRTAGSELLLATVTAPTVQYDDTGAATPTGAPKSVGDIGDRAKPLMLAEWGVEENGAGGAYPNTKAGFYDQVHANLKVEPWSRVKALVYFNSVAAHANCITTSAAAQAAFTSLADDPFFNPDIAAAPPPAAAIAFRAATGAAGNSSTSVAVVVPPSVQAGDGMLLWYSASKHDQTLTDPAGWTVINDETYSGTGNKVRSKLWKKVAGADAGTTVTVAADTTARCILELVAWSGTHADVIEIADAAVDTTTQATHTTPDVVTTIDGDVIVSAWVDRASTTPTTVAWTLPVAENQRIVQSNGGSQAGNMSGLVTDDLAGAAEPAEIGPRAAGGWGAATAGDTEQAGSPTLTISPADGDLVVVAVQTAKNAGGIGAATCTPDQDTWTAIPPVTDANTTDQRSFWFYRIWSTGDATGLTFTCSSAVKWALGAMAWTGADPTTPVGSNATAEHTGTISPTHTTASITPTHAGAWVGACFQDRSGGTWTPPSGYTERVDQRLSGSPTVTSPDLTIVDSAAPVALTAVSLSATSTIATANAVTWIFEIVPASVVGPSTGDPAGTYGSKVATADTSQDRAVTWTVALKPSGGGGANGQHCGFILQP